MTVLGGAFKNNVRGGEESVVDLDGNIFGPVCLDEAQKIRNDPGEARSSND